MTEKNALHSFLPSFGFFGSSELNCLRLQPSEPVTGLRLSLTTDVPEVLNLSFVKFIGSDGSHQQFELGTFECAASSTHIEYTPSGLLSGQGLHSMREMKPSWTIKFAEPTSFTQICIYNRPDYWGCRSVSLLAETCDAHGTWSRIYSRDGAAQFAAACDELLRLASGGLSATSVQIEGGFGSLRNACKPGILRHCQTASIDELRVIFEFLPLYSSEPFEIIDRQIVIACIERLMVIYGDLPMPYLVDFARAFGTKQDIELIEATLSKNIGRQIVFTKHGLVEAKLRQNAAEYASLMNEVITLMKETGRNACAAYGTSLGIYREGKFLANDDDVDILFESMASDDDAVEAEIAQVTKILSAAGFTVNRAGQGLYNLHVFRDDKGIDLFPSWGSGETVSLYMEEMNIRKLPRKTLFPTKNIPFMDMQVAIPGEIEKFLVARYGASWRVPDRFHEWPWQVLPS